MLHNNGILDAIGQTPLVRLKSVSPNRDVSIYAKLEGMNPTGSVKDRVAMSVIQQAEDDGDLTRDKVILVPTSGNTGIAMAMVGRLKGYGVEIVMAKDVSRERSDMLSAYGAKIRYSPAKEGSNGAIKYAEKMATEDKRYYLADQYGNEANPQAHLTTADEILRDLPDADVFVAALGTGGTLTGVGKRLKEKKSDVTVVAAEPFKDDPIPGLRSLDDGFIPPILDLSLLDHREKIQSKTARDRAKQLLLSEGIFAGISSGAVVECAIRYAEKLERGNVVCLLADNGWKYLSDWEGCDQASRPKT